MTLVGHPGTLVPGDGVLYLGDATSLQHLHWPASGVPPGYSGFLAVINTASGGVHLGLIQFIQVVLLSSTPFLAYLLVWRVTARRWAATLAGVIVGADYYLLQWERFVLTEALAACLAMVMIVVLERHIRAPSIRTACFTTLLCAAVVIVHNSFIVIGIPVVVAVAAAAKYHRWRRGLLALGTLYGVVGLFGLVNGFNTGHFALSSTAAGNIRGKIIEYQLQESTNDPRFADIKSALKNETQPIGAFSRHPILESTPARRALLDEYVQDIFSHHRMRFLELGLRDAVSTWIAAPIAFGQPAPGTVPIAQVTASIDQVISGLLPVASVIAIWSFTRRRHGSGLLMIAILGISAAAFLVIGLDGYTEQLRLRSPVDAIGRICVVIAAAELCPLMRANSIRAINGHGHGAPESIL
jgi:hypothetical protein